jgi:hypothetical protein
LVDRGKFFRGFFFLVFTFLAKVIKFISNNWRMYMNAEQQKEYEKIKRQILAAYPNYESLSDERKAEIWQEYMFCLELN